MSNDESVMIIEDEEEIQPLPVISQKYGLIRELNRGSYGVVYLGIDISVNPPEELVLEKNLIDLRKLAAQSKHNTLSNLIILKVGYKILDTLQFIHSQEYVHRDIKPANLMISSNLKADVQVKIIDLDLNGQVLA
uniref:non-specific serine/threonine protein kinase n=1 Tax=Caenorhabditis tropicalis TaxID=1561998 RepID=A0A1I7UWZ3_9PELO